MRLFLAFLLASVSASIFASLPYYPIDFPRDEGAHHNNIPYQYDHLIEWWYFNGKLIADNGEQLSYDAAIFNGSIIMNGRTVSVPMLHMQIVDLDQKKNYGAINDYPIGTGVLSSSQLDITLDENNRLKKTIINNEPVYQLHAQSRQPENNLQLDLAFRPASQPLLINQTGFVQMPENTNSYYYTLPRLKTSGTVTINNKVYHISEDQGNSWMDHQWGDFAVRNYGWEFFSVRLDNGLLANIFLNVEFASGKIVDGIASIVLPSGETRYVPYNQFSIERADYWRDPHNGVNYPQTFKFSFPELKLQLVNKSAFPEQESNGYWEGYCQVDARYKNRVVHGYSVAELVYNPPAAIN